MDVADSILLFSSFRYGGVFFHFSYLYLILYAMQSVLDPFFLSVRKGTLRCVCVAYGIYIHGSIYFFAGIGL